MRKFYFTLMTLVLPACLHAQWVNDSTLNTRVFGSQKMQLGQKAAMNKDGKTFITSHVCNHLGGNMVMQLQCLDMSGYKLLSDSGIALSNHVQRSYDADYKLVIDHSGTNAVVALQDWRNLDSVWNVYAYKMSPTGDFLWGNNGIALSHDTVADNNTPAIALTSDSSYVFAWNWHIHRGIKMQKLDGNGNKMWGSDGMLYLPDSLFVLFTHLVPSDSNSVIATFIKSALDNDAPAYIFAQKFDKDGNPVWPSDIPIMTLDSMPAQYIFQYSTISDNNNGAYISWTDVRAGMSWLGPVTNCFVQHMASNGSLSFPVNGLAVSTNDVTRYRRNPALNFIDNNLYVSYEECTIDAQNYTGLYLQKINRNGQRLFSDTGMVLENLSDLLQILPVTKEFVDNSIITVYFSCVYQANPSISNLKYVITDTSGTIAGRRFISFKNAINADLVLTDLINNLMVCTWNEDDTGEYVIFAQPLPLSENGIGENYTDLKLRCLVYPNPLEENSQLVMDLQEKSRVEAGIYDICGRKVLTLHSGNLEKGSYSFKINKAKLNNGLYLLKVDAGKRTYSCRLIKAG